MPVLSHPIPCHSGPWSPAYVLIHHCSFQSSCKARLSLFTVLSSISSCSSASAFTPQSLSLVSLFQGVVALLRQMTLPCLLIVLGYVFCPLAALTYYPTRIVPDLCGSFFSVVWMQKRYICACKPRKQFFSFQFQVRGKTQFRLQRSFTENGFPMTTLVESGGMEMWGKVRTSLLYKDVVIEGEYTYFM